MSLKIQWIDVEQENYDLDTIRSLEDRDDYLFHKKVSKEMTGSVEKYTQTYYVDPFSSYNIQKNRFPYNICNDMKHYVIWCSPKSNINLATAYMIAGARFPNKKLIVRQNKVRNRTIKTVKHYHVFVG